MKSDSNEIDWINLRCERCYLKDSQKQTKWTLLIRRQYYIILASPGAGERMKVEKLPNARSWSRHSCNCIDIGLLNLIWTMRQVSDKGKFERR